MKLMREDIKKLVLILGRLGFAALGISALVGQYIKSSQAAGFSPVNFFSFFTVDSNILTIIVLLLGVIFLILNKKSSVFDSWRGAVTVYMALTGIVFAVLLREAAAQTESFLPWADTVLHTIMPAVVIIDWLLDKPIKKIGVWTIVSWLLFPLAWLAYTLIRGNIVTWYPYSFLDPQAVSYLGVIAYCFGITLFVLLLSWLIALLSHNSSSKTA